MQQLSEEGDLEPRARPAALVPARGRLGCHERKRVAEGQPQVGAPPDEAERRHEHPDVAQPEVTQGLDDVREGHPLTPHPRLGPDLQQAHDETDRHRDADRPTGGRQRADEPGQPRVAPLEEQERAQHRQQEDRVGVHRRHDEERVGVEQEEQDRRPRTGGREPRRGPQSEEGGRGGAGQHGDEAAGDLGVAPDEERDAAHEHRVGREEGDRRLLTRARRSTRPSRCRSTSSSRTASTRRASPARRGAHRPGDG